MAKRGQNEGSIFFEKRTGRWVATINLGYEIKDGKRRRKRKKFVGETRKAVHQRLTAALDKQAQNLPIATSREPFSTYFERWLVASKNRLRESTLASYADV